MSNIPYLVIIAPITQIMEIAFIFVYKIFHNLVFALFGVSAAVSLLSLPLYMIAERWQNIERETIKGFASMTGKIKAVFRGDEQYMILSTLYRQRRYHPVFALRNSFGILVQIPFFIAAYSYISNLEILSGTRFLFINDLTQPDSLFRIGSLPVHILPILMTLINCVSGAIYTKGFPARDKIQVYGTAFVFLALLYNSPAALVLYWTLNNVFSLVKNIFYKIKNPRKALYVVICIISAAFIYYLLFFMPTRALPKRLLIVFAVSVFFFLPLILKGIRLLQKYILSGLAENSGGMTLLFLLSCAVLAALTGWYIPSSVIASSPEEFCFVDSYASPDVYIVHAAFFFLGLFVFWPLCVYFLFGKRIKALLAFFLTVAAALSAVYALIFNGNYGTINNTFNFTTTGVLRVSFSAVLFCLLGLVLTAVLITFLVKISKTRYLCPLLAIVAASLCAAGAYHAVGIRAAYRELLTRRGDAQETASLEPVFSLSKTEKNVIVMMADGALNGFVPLIFEDHPELYGQFDGFTLYPNTVSFAAHTLMGVPPVWGGYDYTPFEMNRRNETPLAEKHNEALLTLPLLFSQAGFNVTVTDPSWANYAWIPDLSIYKNLDNTRAFNTIRRYTGLWYERNGLDGFGFTGQKIMRNVIWFSFLKITIPVLRLIVYDSGFYWGTDNMGSSIVEFIKSYAVLDLLPELTSFNSEKPSALLLTNEATHEFVFLQPPAYTPGSEPSKIGNSPYAENSAYHANSALYLKLGQWFDVLKENGVYDNTRIIITADHGGGVGGMISGEPLRITGESRERYNPVLLVKDFGDHGPLAVDAAFMTNADVPALAVRGLLDHPVNPFTGTPLSDTVKKDEVLITTGHIPMADGHGKYVFSIKKNQWMRVHDNIFDSANWEAVEK